MKKDGNLAKGNRPRLSQCEKDKRARKRERREARNPGSRERRIQISSERQLRELAEDMRDLKDRDPERYHDLLNENPELRELVEAEIKVTKIDTRQAVGLAGLLAEPTPPEGQP